MHDWLEQLTDYGQAVLVSVLRASGSAPRETGANMLVTGSEVSGTIGGGNLEWQAIQCVRREFLHQQSHITAAAKTVRYALGPALGQCCGGGVELLFEPVSKESSWFESACAARNSTDSHWLLRDINGATVSEPSLVTGQALQALTDHSQLYGANACCFESKTGVTRYAEPLCAPASRLVLFGAGHVGRALVAQLALLQCGLYWIDSRVEQFPGTVAGEVRIICSDDPVGELSSLPVTVDAAVVMTHSHALDFEICKSLLANQRVPYVGLIGSTTKAVLFSRRLQQRGVDATPLVCPIGKAAIDSKRPNRIALAIASELIRYWENKAE